MPRAGNAENNNVQQGSFRDANPAKVRARNFYSTSKTTDDRQQSGFAEERATHK